MGKFAQQVCNSLLGPAEVDVHLILKESVVALYAGDRAIGSASSRHRLICKIGNGRLKVIVEFSRALERGRWERRETEEGGKASRQAEGSQLSRRRPSCVTSNCDEFKNVGGNLWRRRRRRRPENGNSSCETEFVESSLLPSSLLFRRIFD